MTSTSMVTAAVAARADQVTKVYGEGDARVSCARAGSTDQPRFTRPRSAAKHRLMLTAPMIAIARSA